MPDILSDSFIQAVPDLTLLVRSDGNILARLGGRELNDGVGARDSVARTLEELWSADVARRLRQLVRHALKDRTPLDRKYRDAKHCYEVRVRPQGIDRVLMVFREIADDDVDITPESSRTQPLATRSQLMRVLSQALSQARLRERRLAVITVYLGGLTDIERALDTTVSEQLASAAAQRLHTSISRERAMFIRSSSTETGYVAPIADHVLAAVIEGSPTREALRTIVMAMREALVQPFALAGRNLRITPSFGISIAPEDSTDARELINRARAAMRDAHFADHAIAFHSDTLRLRALSRLDSEQELRWALEHEQFQLRYRPLYAMSDQHLAAVQAQPCWTHPVRGHVTSGEFLALAETSEIAREIGRWMLSRACADLGRVDDGTMRIVVTLCRRHVLEESLLADVMDAIGTNGADPQRLSLRVGQRALTGSSELLARLSELRAAGVRIIVERFGAGHMAMERIAELPVDAVSLEPMLFCNLESDARMRKVCRSVIDVAHALGWQVAADEISRRNEIALLRELGCDFIGGKVFGASQDLSYVPRTAEI